MFVEQYWHSASLFSPSINSDPPQWGQSMVISIMDQSMWSPSVHSVTDDNGSRIIAFEPCGTQGEVVIVTVGSMVKLHLPVHQMQKICKWESAVVANELSQPLFTELLFIAVHSLAYSIGIHHYQDVAVQCSLSLLAIGALRDQPQSIEMICEPCADYVPWKDKVPDVEVG